jgi:hypothetical protein
VDRAHALIDRPLLDEFAEDPDDIGLVLVIHRQVGVFPFAEDPQTLEVIPLKRDELFRVFARGATDFDDGHLVFLRAERLFHFDLIERDLTQKSFNTLLST